MWTGTFDGTDVSVVMGSSTGKLWTVRLDPTLEGAWGQSYKIDTAGNGIIRISPNALAEPYPFVENLISHEIGEMLGFNHSDCAGSVMKSIQPSDLNAETPIFPGEAERCVVETQYIGPVRRDDDGDGYSPEEGDCDDGDASVNPGITPQCFMVGDYNCNGIPDADEQSCESPDQPGSPIVIDLNGDGIRLTSASEGVLFDLEGSGQARVLSWTEPNGDDAWLALDRNANGSIDDGTELFGNFTAQPPSGAPNGFIALDSFDENGDGWIDTKDDVYTQLRLWLDQNHDGISQASELRTLASAGITRLSLDYSQSSRRDRYGNQFRYKARIEDVRGQNVGKFAWDVFLVALPTNGVPASVRPNRR